LVMKLGQVNQTVEVTGEPPTVETNSSTISATVDSTTVRELPLNGRDWTSLATLEPGVVSIPNQATTSFSANKGNRGFGNQLADSGHRPEAPFGCEPNTFPTPAPAGMQYCSNVLGNSGRNRFYGPRLTTVDLSIFKNTRIPAISETFNIQFRAEFFNILNQTNFLSPGFLNTFGQNNSVFDVDGSSLPTAL